MPIHLRNLTVWILLILFCTGIASILVEYKIVLVTPEVKKNIIRIHISWTVITAIILGMVIEGHVRKVWKTRNTAKKTAGITVLSMFLLLLITSFVLRHIKMPALHETAKILHTIFGVLLIMVFIWHIAVKKQALQKSSIDT